MCLCLTKHVLAQCHRGRTHSLAQLPIHCHCSHAPSCHFTAADECRAPVISLSKEAGVADLVGPVMKPEDADVHLRHMPWDAKLDKAFFR